MIRINLIGTERRAAKAVSKGVPAQKLTVIGSLVVVLTLLGLGWRYWAIEQEKAETERNIVAAQREEERLAEILKRVQEFENRKKILEARVTLIDELRKGQSAPVHMIDQLSRSLPEMTWLTGVSQDGYTLTIQGRTLTLTSLSDFIGNLEATRFFARPVDIVDTSVVGGDNKGPELISFTIRGTFQMAGIDPLPPSTTPARKGPAPKGGKRG